MSRLHYNLPPLTTLLAFEAAARHLSFKDAAQDLSVTPGAVSHQIKALEGELGTDLFIRKHRRVELTEHGQELYSVLSASFSQISRQLAKIQQANDAEIVTVGSTTAVAALWLSPALIDFWRDYPDININQITQDRPLLNSHEFDFFIRYGKDRDESLSHTVIYRDELVPIAEPGMALKLRDCSLKDLAQERLIHLNTPSQSWTSWSEWFFQLGYKGDLSSGTKVTSYSIALQIARKGAGVALGWKRLVQPMLNSGKLAIVSQHVLPAPHRFYLVGQADDQLSPHALKLKEWILKQAESGSV